MTFGRMMMELGRKTRLLLVVSVGVALAALAIAPALGAGAPPKTWYAESETYVLGKNGQPDPNEKPIKSRQWASGQKFRTEILGEGGATTVVITRRDLGLSWTWTESPKSKTKTYMEMPIDETRAPRTFSEELDFGPNAEVLEQKPLGNETVAGQLCAKRRIVVQIKDDKEGAMTIKVTCTAWISKKLELPVKVITSTEITGLSFGEGEGDEEDEELAAALAGGGFGMSMMILYKNFNTNPIPASMFEVPPGYTKQAMPAFPGMQGMPGMKMPAQQARSPVVALITTAASPAAVESWDP